MHRLTKGLGLFLTLLFGSQTLGDCINDKKTLVEYIGQYQKAAEKSDNHQAEEIFGQITDLLTRAQSESSCENDISGFYATEAVKLLERKGGPAFSTTTDFFSAQKIVHFVTPKDRANQGSVYALKDAHKKFKVKGSFSCENRELKIDP
jgi:hypothetical protein